MDGMSFEAVTAECITLFRKTDSELKNSRYRRDSDNNPTGGMQFNRWSLRFADLLSRFLRLTWFSAKLASEAMQCNDGGENFTSPSETKQLLWVAADVTSVWGLWRLPQLGGWDENHKKKWSYFQVRSLDQEISVHVYFFNHNLSFYIF